jgi:hypothetical protein
MADRTPLSDNRAHDLLIEARRALGDAPGETVRADTALRAAREALSGLALALLFASETGSDNVPGVKDPGDA